MMSFPKETGDEKEEYMSQSDKELDFAFLYFFRNYIKPEHTDDQLKNSFRRSLFKHRSRQNVAQDCSQLTPFDSTTPKIQLDLPKVSPTKSENAVPEWFLKDLGEIFSDVNFNVEAPVSRTEMSVQSTSKDAIPKILPKEVSSGDNLNVASTSTSLLSTDEEMIPNFTKVINKFARATNVTDMKSKAIMLRKSTWTERVLPMKIVDILQAGYFVIDEKTYFTHQAITFRTVKINGVVRSIDLREKKCHFVLYDDTDRIEVRYLFKQQLLDVKQVANAQYQKASANLRETRTGTLTNKFKVPAYSKTEYFENERADDDQRATFRLAKKTILLARSAPMPSDIRFGMKLTVVGTVRQFINDGTDLVRVIYPWAVQEDLDGVANMGNIYPARK